MEQFENKNIGILYSVMHKNVIHASNVLMLAIVSCLVLSFTCLLLSPSSASAINSSIILNLSSSTLSLDLTPKLGGGFAKSGNNTINVKTNHYTGYTLKITAGTNDTNSTKLVNIESNTTIDSIEANVSEADFSANTNAAATSYNGKWGFMPSQYVTTDNTNPSSPIHTTVDNDPTGANASNAVYLPAPDYATGTTLDITSSANPDTFNTYTISLGARAGMETTAGTYSNTFNILAIGNPIIYSITFSDNTGDSSITNLPTGTGSVSTSDIDILLPTTIPTRTGYDFIGWCKIETTTNGTVCPSNTPYPASQPAAGQTPAVPSYYEIDQTTDNTELTFYATWSPKTYTITLDRNGGDAGSTSTTATYNATTLAAITVPTRANTTGTRTISGLSANGTNASGATVTFPSSGNCTSTSNCKSSNTTTYTFNGWYKESGATNKIASDAASPALQPSTSYTNSSSQWTSTSGQTLYAGWTASAGAYASVTLPTITKTGYTCGWDTNQSATNPTYTSGGSLTPNGNITLYGICKANTYTITLNNNTGTGGSSSTTATYDATTLATITNPTKANVTGTRTISGFTLPSGNKADGATVTWPTSGCTSSSSCNSTNTTTYTFNGWYKESGATNKIASNATTPVLSASTSYTDANGKWISTSAQTLYAGWTASVGNYSSVTLPAISKTGHTCGWTATSTGATSISYQSSGSITPSANTTLYGVCTANTYSLTINFAGSGVSSVQVRTASGTGGTLKGTVSTSGGSVSGLTYNTAYYLYPTFSSNYELDSWAKTSGQGTLSSTSVSNPTFTMGAGAGTVTITGKSSCSGYMQDLTPSTIATRLPNVGDTTKVYDSRDNTCYTIGKLADGNYWLLDNLAIDLTNNTVLNGMSVDNTNASNTTLGYLKSGGGTTSDKYATAAVANWTSSTGNSYSAPLVNLTNKDVVPTDVTSTAGGYKVGGYYNYCAASAGSYCYGNGTSAGTSSGNATEDICPKNWRMPTGGSSGEYATLYSNSNYNTAATYRSALRLPLSGYFSRGSASSQGSNGSFWSSTRSGSNYMYYLYVSASTVSPSYLDDRNLGDPVRCLLETRTISDVTYMQDVTPAIANNTAVGTTATLKDKRDEQSYKVGKLADGNVWLLDNLALDLTNSTILTGMNETNTNASNTTLGYLKNGGGTTSDKYAITAVSNWSTNPTYGSSYSYSDPLVDLGSKNTVPSDATSTAGGYKVGGYYNYCAASAGSYCYGDGTSAGTSSGNATEDICPKNWRMPTGSTSGEYKTLYTNSNYNTYANYRAALHLPLSGVFSYGSASNQGNSSFFWSSTRIADYTMRGLDISASYVTIGSDFDRRNGDAVRCILDS